MQLFGLSKRLVLLLVVSLLLGALAAGAASAQEPRRGGTLTYALDYDPQRMDPLNTTWMTDATQQIYLQVVMRDPSTGEFVPGLAERWEISEDGMTYTFYLKRGVKFHDGEPFTAHAVKYFLDKAVDPSVPYAFNFHYTQIGSVEVIDDYTLRIHMREPDARVLTALATVYSGLPSPAAREAAGPDYGTTVVVGTGPFKLEEWIPGEHLIIVRNEEYAGWGPDFFKNKGPAYLDRVIYRYVPDPAARAIEVETGNVDIAVGVPPADLERLQRNPDIEVVELPSMSYRFLSINTQKFSDVRLRRAIFHAINQQELVDAVLLGYGYPARGYVPHHIPGFFDAASVYEYNPDKARQLIAEAGYTERNAQGIAMRNGEKLTFDLYTEAEPEYRQIGEVLRQQLARVGIEVNVYSMDFNSFQAAIMEGRHDGGIQHWDWDDIEIVGLLLYSGFIPWPNHSWTNDPTIDRLFAEASRSRTLEERNEKFIELQRYMTEEVVAWVPLYVPNRIYAINKRVRDYVPQQYDSLYPHLIDTWLEW